MNHYKNIWDYKSKAKENLEPFAYDYLTGGADDLRTFQRNMDAFQHFQIRPRRLVDVRNVDTSISLFGKKWKSPIVLAPVGMQGMFHSEGELATAKAADTNGHLLMTSTVSTLPFTEISKVMENKPWFQLYTSSNIETTKYLLSLAKEGGSEVIVLTVDVPVAGNREKHAQILTGNMREHNTLGNFKNLEADFNAGLDWSIIPWLRNHCDMKIVIKGILTKEDAALCLEHEVDGLIVSNHGGRQLESDLSTIEVLGEIVQTVKGEIPVFLDGGIRRGTDIFKALAMGANAVCIGRAYIYGLAAEGQKGVEGVLDILQTELERNMRIAGVTDLSQLTSNWIREKRF